MTFLEGSLPFLVLISTLISACLLLLPSQHGARVRNSDGKSKIRVQVLVLGDIGRSPRMQYHALSIARHGGLVDLIGVLDKTTLHPDIKANPSIQIYPLPSPPSFLQTGNRWAIIILGLLKALIQAWSLCMVLGYRTKPAKWLLVQNPPSVPTLAVAGVISFLRHTGLVIDWHNLGYTVLGLKIGREHPYVRFSSLYERICSRFATAHITVTDAMARVIRCDYRTSAPVFTLHDRPTSSFRPLRPEQRLSSLQNLPEVADYAESIELGKTKLLVSSTSWTPDEDFGVLLDALVSYSDLAMTSHPYLPEIVAVITGKGPLKNQFLDRIQLLKAQDKLEMVNFRTAWLSTEEYASLLSAADLGVSLHQSTSGVDLPMKVVDMFGAGLPIAGYGDFEAWPELVKDGKNGTSFSNAQGLQAILMDLFGSNGSGLRSLKEGAIQEGRRRWDDEWDPVAGRLFGLVE